MFFFEKWRVYQLAVELREIADELRRTAGPGLAKDMDHIVRTTATITSNIGEGALRKPKKAKINFYDIARGAAGEYNAVLKSIRNLHPNRKLNDRGCETANHVSVLL